MKGNWDRIPVNDTEDGADEKDERSKCEVLREFMFLRWELKMKGKEEWDDGGEYEV
jgi:hypothetical protein